VLIYSEVQDLEVINKESFHTTQIIATIF